MLESAYGNIVYKKNHVYDVDEAKAQNWIAAKRAIAVVDETANKKPVEKAAKK